MRSIRIFFYLMFFFSLGLLCLLGCLESPFLACLGLVGLVSVSCGLVSLICHVWVSYVILITFLGGMMVLFSYSSSLSQSVQSSSSPSWGYLIGGLPLLVMGPPHFLKYTPYLSSLFFSWNLGLLTLLTLYLLACLFLCVKMVEVYRGNLNT
uniref:NADH dehydrogenase subunit 6 n=1 Tax=Pandarus rhincodonicus TaxID=1473543 RepID=A0A024J4N0_PANRH|nr:NADH dehydrogenase subunit 6 [Pandarus rhincodonicus]